MNARATLAALAAVLAVYPSALLAGEVKGAGASFPRTVYLEWAKASAAKTGVTLAYDAIGIADGIKRLETGAVDFGCADVALGVPQLAAKGLVQFPTVIGGVVPVVNVPGVAPGALRLSGPVLAEIFLGRLTSWNAPAIAALNGGMTLPTAPIRVAHPVEASGSTFVLTSYLSVVSPEWRERVGAGFTVKWPVGEERGLEAVSTFVIRTVGAVAFADFAHAADEGLSTIRLQNKAGEFVSPNFVSFQAAAANAPWESTPGFALLLLDQPGPGSWPLTTPAFALLPATPRDPGRAADVLSFFHWALSSGASIAASSGYVSLPPSVATLVETAWKRQIKRADGTPVWVPRAPGPSEHPSR